MSEPRYGLDDPLAAYQPRRTWNPWRRCAVCGYRGWVHWLYDPKFYDRSIFGDPPPERRGLW